MAELKVSINNTIDDIDVARQLIKTFEAQEHINVDLQVFDWGDAWKEFMQISLYRKGPVISETGETWMGSLASRNCLRHFTPREIARIGGRSAFQDSIWQNSLDFDGQTVIGIPWSLDTYLLYYHKDHLKKAGVREDKAFGSMEDFYATLEKLLASGCEIPLAIPTSGNTTSLIHNASSWVWARGGDYITPDGTQVTFSDPKTLAGLKDYFGLYRFMPPAARLMDDTACDQVISQGKVAVTIRFLSLLYTIQHNQGSTGLFQKMGMAVQPSIPFVGGSTLIIWNHIPPEQEHAAVEFIRFLTSTNSSQILFKKAGLIPARLDALAEVEKDKVYEPLVQSLQRGRGFPRVRLWGLVEDKLTHAFNDIWQRIFSTPNPDIEAILMDVLVPLENRLNMTLSQ